MNGTPVTLANPPHVTNYSRHSAQLSIAGQVCRLHAPPLLCLCQGKTPPFESPHRQTPAPCWKTPCALFAPTPSPLQAIVGVQQSALFRAVSTTFRASQFRSPFASLEERKCYPLTTGKWPSSIIYVFTGCRYRPRRTFVDLGITSAGFPASWDRLTGMSKDDGIPDR